MEAVKISLKDFQNISKEMNLTAIHEIIRQIKAGLKYIIVSEKKDYNLMLYNDENGNEALGMNEM